MKNLIKLEKVNGSNWKDLCDMFHKIESMMRALEAIGIH